jgi:hypothetical protein
MSHSRSVIYGENGTSDERRLGRGQEADRRGDFLGLSESAEGVSPMIFACCSGLRTVITLYR